MRLFAIILALAAAMPAYAGADFNSNAIATLDSMDRLTVPHYWCISWPTMRPENHDLVKAIVRVTGAIAFTHTSGDAAEYALRVHNETGCAVGLFIVMRVPETFGTRSLDWMDAHRKKLRAIADLGVPIDFVFFHYEGDKATQGRVYVWHEMIREFFPDACIGFYHHPGWSMSWSGSGVSSVYEGLVVPADVGVFNAYGLSSAHNSMCRRMNAEAFGGPVCPVIAWDFCYGDVVDPDGTGGWHSSRDLVRVHASTWNMGRHFGVFANRGNITQVVLWRFMLQYRNGDTIDTIQERDARTLQDFEAYVTGWHTKPMPESVR